MEEGISSEDEERVDSYVALEEGGDEHCVVEDVETPMVLDDAKEDNVNFQYCRRRSLAGGVVEPMLGMEFTTIDDARNFYNVYAKQTGFSIHVNSYYRSKKDNSIISRESAKKVVLGDDTKRRRARPITREGCEALMTVRKQDNGKWYVAKLEKNHNHKLVSPAMWQFLSLSNFFGSPEMGLNSPTNVLTEDSNSCRKMVFTAQKSVEYVGKGRLGTFGIDAQSLLGFFSVMQASDPAFYYAIQVDEEDRLSSIFWVDTRSRISYNCFSDVVAFDTTYQVNHYKMPFAPFTGVNHLNQSMLFGCVLLADETESTFIWLFTTLLEAMSGKQPGLIITDYESAISRAVEQWHIMSKMPREMGDTYSSLPRTFQVEFDKCLKSKTPDEFESAWPMILEKYNLRGNEWLQSLYIDHKLWVPTYVRDILCRAAFAEQHEKALEDRYEKEARPEFETFYTKPILKTPLPMEKQAADIYMRKMFTVFQDEVFESLALAVKFSGENGGSSTYKVARFDEKHKVHFVCINIAEQVASCTFKMFEFKGVLCCHVLGRRNRDAKDEAILDLQASKNLQYNILYQEAIKCAEEGMISDHSFKVALNALREARIKNVDTKKNAINAKKLETMASTSYQYEITTISSQVDSSSALVTPLEHLKDKTRESLKESNALESEKSSNRDGLCTNCKCPGHDSITCLRLKDSGQNTFMDSQNQKIASRTGSAG
ncbi:hypothetical protein I3760_04G058000 [Carya illinoinensis]|nr:hypothetical protein I3760_04G058000 [Carya illinoinensis]